MSRRSLLVLAVALGALPAQAQAADPPGFTTVKLAGARDRSEPRIAVARDDVRWAVSNTTSGAEIVYTSRDGGQTFQKTPGDPPQTRATIDVDVVAMPNGRILASELDTAGLNFPSGVTDDQGKTWKSTSGSNMLADEDRQWFAVGPDDPTTKKPTVYLLYHNLGSGTVQHNMFVAKSTDGGETFGAPVPSAQPGSDAYADLQCSDSGGPSSISVNAKGRVYITYTTRAGVPASGAPDAGGCAASIFGPLEFNVVNATRVWVSTSPDGSPGSWKDSLAVDNSKTNQVSSMQLAYGQLDNQGGMYVAYPEAPGAYPKLDGSGVKLVYQKPDAKGELSGTWSKPVTLVPQGGPGSDLVHLAVGDPGKVAVAYYRGEPNPAAGKDPLFFLHALQSLDVLSASPTVTDVKVSKIPAYQWTVTGMMGICDPSSPAGGVEAGLTCSRSTDVWGIALDASCRLSIAWPTSGASTGSTKGVENADPGTFVSTQTSGPGLCADAAALPGGSGAAPFQPPAAPAAPGAPSGGGSGGGTGGGGSSGGGGGSSSGTGTGAGAGARRELPRPRAPHLAGARAHRHHAPGHPPAGLGERHGLRRDGGPRPLPRPLRGGRGGPAPVREPMPLPPRGRPLRARRELPAHDVHRSDGGVELELLAQGPSAPRPLRRVDPGHGHVGQRGAQGPHPQPAARDALGGRVGGQPSQDLTRRALDELVADPHAGVALVELEQLGEGVDPAGERDGARQDVRLLGRLEEHGRAPEGERVDHGLERGAARRQRVAVVVRRASGRPRPRGRAGGRPGGSSPPRAARRAGPSSASGPRAGRGRAAGTSGPRPRRAPARRRRVVRSSSCGIHSKP